MIPKAVVVHCTASTFGDKDAVESWHVARGFVHIGYHRLILNGFRKKGQAYDPSLDGAIQLGREDSDVGAHCKAKGMNLIALGVCYVGDPSEPKPPQGPDYLEPGKPYQGRVAARKAITRRQLDSLVYALAKLCKVHGLDPLGTLRHQGREVFVISQHSDHDPSKPFCASLNMSILRKQVAQKMKELEG